MAAVRSALTWAAILFLILAWLPALAVVRLFDRDPGRWTTGRLFRRLGAAITKVNPAWKITRSGTLPENRRGPYVVVANHQSNADIPLISTLPWEMKWVAKAGLFRLPVVGWMMRLAGDIPVERSDTASRAAVLVRAREALDKRVSVMFMPEGTRSRDARVRRFQDGAFRLAIEASVPVLPIALDGTSNTLPSSGWRFGEADVRLHVFDPIPTDGLEPADAPALRARVRSMIIEQIAAWRGVAANAIDVPGTNEDAAKRASARPAAAARG